MNGRPSRPRRMKGSSNHLMRKKNMKTRIYIITAAFSALLCCACTAVKEADLLSPKVFFESVESKVEISDEIENFNLDLRARLSSACGEEVTVSFEICGKEEVDRYNRIHGTNYETFDENCVHIAETDVKIGPGEIYTSTSTIELTQVNEIQEGSHKVLPIRIREASTDVIESERTVYYIITKPVKLLNAYKFANSYIYVPIAAEKEYTSLTFETLIRINSFGSNNTIMGHEGILILRIGDEGGGLARNLLQITGKKEFNVADPLVTNKWYHIAFTYDQPSGKAVIYLNGEKAAESSWDTPSFLLGGPEEKGGGFYIGAVHGFMWGERPINASFCETRMWSVARSEKEITQNMLQVAPDSEGLEFYYKMNGADQKQENGKWIVEDASANGLNGVVNGGYSKLNVDTLDSPISL